MLIILIIFGIFQYGIGKICGFTMVPDEFGYWASAAEKIGYDWSEVTSLDPIIPLAIVIFYCLYYIFLMMV